MKLIKLTLSGDVRTVSDQEAEMLIRTKRATLVREVPKEKAVRETASEKAVK